MPELSRPDGIEIHWDERGEGPTVIITHGWTGHPEVFAGLIDELARDHRVVTYDPRGAGQSTRSGPYDVDTDTADMTALLEEVGGGVPLMVADVTCRGVRLLAERPDLVPAAVSYGGPPLNREAMGGSEAMIASDSVVGAFQEMLDRDYRGALRSVVTAANPQMSEDELRERVASQVDYYPQEAAVARVRAWSEDDPIEYAQAAGERLWIVATPDAAGTWFPKREEAIRLIRDLLPEAQVVEIEDGALSRPDLTADVIRQAVRATAGAAAERK